VRFALYECPDGVETTSRNGVVYDLEQDVASRGSAHLDGPALAWALPETEPGLVTDRHKVRVVLEVEVELDPGRDWVVRCDRVDFPPGGVAYRHVHPGPGIRRLLFGELTIDTDEGQRTYGEGEAWFEDAHSPVLATASATEDTAFVRVLVLPSEWAGKRTNRYLDPTDAEKPTLQRATVLLEEALPL
jgi:quercetin dioxygenase-like cupin family protein